MQYPLILASGWEIVSALAETAGAVATFAAVVVALWPEVRKRLVTERMDIAVGTEPPYYSDATAIIHGTPMCGKMLRLEVSNSGDETANDVRILLGNVTRKNTVRGWVPANLAWTHTGKRNCDTIPPRFRQFCDLCAVINRQVHFSLEVQPLDQYNVFDLGEFTLEIALATERGVQKRGTIRLTIEEHPQTRQLTYVNIQWEEWDC